MDILVEKLQINSGSSGFVAIAGLLCDKDG